MAAAMTAAERELPAIRLSTRSFTGDECTDLFDAPRVEHVSRLDPATARRADAEPHLAPEPFRPVAVAVDGDCDTGRSRTPRDSTVHIQMSWRAVDFHRRSGFRRCLKQRVKVQLEAG